MLGFRTVLIAVALAWLLPAEVHAANATIRIGGTGQDEGGAVATDSSGNFYITGYFNGTVDFDPGAGTTNLTSGSGDEVFVAKYDSDGDLVWAKHFNSGGNDVGTGITVDGSGNVYTTGSFLGTVDFDPGAGTANLTSTGSTDIFVVKLNSSGSYVWAVRAGGGGADAGNGIALDSSNNVHVTGNYSGNNIDFDPGAGTANLTSAGSGSSTASLSGSLTARAIMSGPKA